MPPTPQDLNAAITATIGSGPFQQAIRPLRPGGNLASLAALVLSANKSVYATGPAALATYALSAFGRALAGVADDVAARTALGVAYGSTAGTVAQGNDARLGTDATVTTTNATVTTLASYTPADLSTVTLTVTVSANVGGGTGAGYVLAGTFRRSGATTTQIGATGRLFEVEDVAGWDAVFDVSGAIVRVRVTGSVATSVVWVGRLGVVG